jgi:cytoskeletal protein CcmA (bactofilin family)
MAKDFLSDVDFKDNLVTLTSTDAGSSAAPILELYRNSASPADSDYIGQIKFQGENDNDQKVVYAKITGKISDASDTTEDGIIEIAHQKAGSNNISARFTSTALKLINGTGLEIADGLLTLGSTAVTSTAAELNLLDGITAGTVSASLAVIADSNKDVTGFRNVTLTGELDAATLDISGNADIDGTTNLDAVDIDGAVQIDGAVTVGVDDTGVDVKFFGATSGKYMLWDESADSLIVKDTVDAVNFKVNGGQGSDGQVLTSTGSGVAWENATGGSGSPGGSNTQIQFNNSGSFGGSSNLTFDGTNLTLAGDATIGDTLKLTGNDVSHISNNTSSNREILQLRGKTALSNSAGMNIYGDGDSSHAGKIKMWTGNTERFVLDNSGGFQFNGSLTVGVDDTGYDVKFFGATSGAYLHWDESADKLLTAGGAVVDIVKDKLLIGGTAVTTTAAELNLLDGITAGTVSASLAVIADSNKDVTGFRNVTLTGELDAATLDISGNADIDGTTNLDAVDIDGAVQIDNTVTVGVDDTGYDVKFHGATAGAYMLWDESADTLKVKDSTKLVVEKDSAAAILQIASYHDTEATAPILEFLKGDGSASSPAAVDDDAILGRINWYGYEDSDSAAQGAYIMAKVNGTPGDGDMPTELLFGTSADGSESPTLRYRIGPDGVHNFGDDHSTYLNIKQGTTGTTGQIRWTFNQADTATYATMGMVYDDRATDGWHLNAGYPITIDGKESTNAPIQFRTNGTHVAQFDTDGAFKIVSSTAKTPDASWSGQFQISAGTGSAYTGGIAIDNTAMWVGHNSGSRELYLATNETARVKIAADGEMMLPNVPAFRAFKSGTSTVTSTGAGIWVCDSEIFDNGGNFNTTNGKFYAPVDGYYFFTWHMFMHTSYNNDTDTYWGFVATGDNAWFNHGDEGVDGGQSISALFHLDAGDVCYPYIASASKTLTAYTSAKYNAFNGYLVG